MMTGLDGPVFLCKENDLICACTGSRQDFMVFRGDLGCKMGVTLYLVDGFFPHTSGNVDFAGKIIHIIVCEQKFSTISCRKCLHFVKKGVNIIVDKEKSKSF